MTSPSGMSAVGPSRRSLRRSDTSGVGGEADSLGRRWTDAIGPQADIPSDGAQFQKATFARARAEAIAAGFASAQDYETAMALMDDPTTMYYSNPMVTAWCRRLV